MNKQVRLSGIAFESLVNGPGLRRVIFAQGCIHNCKGCFNPDTHDMQGGQMMDMDKIIDDVKSNPMIRGITFSGGDCLEQADKFAYMAKKFKELGLNIWCYTGYTYEYILENEDKRIGWSELLDNIDVLIDGRFEENKRDISLRYKGSSNQRIIDVKESLKNDRIVIIEY
ncbi:anaerobic ribonucleoside-triphosphate reductase activating protein [Clostridium magnum]|uniref:Anaerobic ribonucleoside-triphosphate reductase-activating protein n=1 Tax=Clostridium magnum DSM 2767 TaxID=1121326 RepID=A0A161YI63_9CLOT|nr:anaerobic ribonucleoside-triphosphate reductase activating protein [Clostridium magnum]KZL90012.1 pyruvate formate-lyase 1-activating enzyme [Clostridium magnum DSM 2767]SHI87442.1 anaerobic ribonucleoside-triphosphate reductase activating protein [Clostridium magnum DSM 2767]